jgi:RNA polymerase sigma-70 factor (ECF subfamily)
MEQSIHNEPEVLAAAARGDRKAFGQLVRAYQRRAYAAAYTLVGNRDDALELSQDAFVKAFKAMNRFDLSMPFYPWLHRIVRNTSLNHLKKKKRRGESSLDEMMESGFDTHAPTLRPDDCATREELLKHILSRYPPGHRDVAIARRPEEIAYRSRIAQPGGRRSLTMKSRILNQRNAVWDPWPLLRDCPHPPRPEVTP